MFEGGLGVDKLVVQAKASPSTVYMPPDPSVTPVYLPNVEYRDHRSLSSADAAALVDTRQRIQHYIDAAEKAISEGAYGTAGTASMQELKKLGCTNCFQLNGVPIATQIRQARDLAKTQLVSVTAGTAPFATFRNIVDGTIWGKYYNPSTKILIIKKVPAHHGWGLDDLFGYLGDAIVWVYDQVKDWVISTLCPYLRKPEVQFILSTAATVALTSALSPYMSPMLAKAVAGLVVSIGIMKLVELCGFPFSPPASAPTTSSGGGGGSPTPQRKYPPGSISRYNTDRRAWVVYVPNSTLGAVESSGMLGAPHDVVPPVPDGFHQVAEEKGNAPPQDTTPQGEERDARWYDNKAVLGGVGVAIVGGIVWTYARRRK